MGAVAQPVKTPSPSSFLLTHPGGNRWFKCLGSCPLWRPGWSCWLLAWTWPSLRLLPTVEEWTNRHMTFLLFGLGPLILPTPKQPEANRTPSARQCIGPGCARTAMQDAFCSQSKIPHCHSLIGYHNAVSTCRGSGSKATNMHGLVKPLLRRQGRGVACWGEGVRSSNPALSHNSCGILPRGPPVLSLPAHSRAPPPVFASA